MHLDCDLGNAYIFLSTEQLKETVTIKLE